MAILIPACESSSPAFQMMYSAFKFFLGGGDMKLSKNSTVDDKVHEEKISGPRQKKKVLGHLPQLDDK